MRDWRLGEGRSRTVLRITLVGVSLALVSTAAWLATPEITTMIDARLAAQHERIEGASSLPVDTRVKGKKLSDYYREMLELPEDVERRLELVRGAKAGLLQSYARALQLDSAQSEEKEP